MRRKINYIADYMYMVTKPPTGAEPLPTQLIKLRAVIDKMVEKFTGPEKENG